MSSQHPSHPPLSPLSLHDALPISIAPAIAAMVSVSPPSAAAAMHAAQASEGCRLAMPNAVGTDSADSTPVPRLPLRSASRSEERRVGKERRGRCLGPAALHEAVGP